MLKIISAKVTASPGGSGWVQIHCFSPSEPEKAQGKGQLFVIAASKDGKEGVEAISLEREIAGKLRGEYYNSLQGKPFDALKYAIQKTIDSFIEKVSNLELSCCVYINNVVYTSSFGGGRVVINRGGVLAPILESGEEVITASGFPKENDIIIIGTKSFFNKVSNSELGNTLNNKNPESSAEELAPLIYEGGEEGTAGALIIKFEQDLEFVQTSEVPSTQKNLVQNMPEVALPSPIEIRSDDNQGVDLKKKLSTIFSGFGKKIPRRNIYIKPTFQDEAVSHSRKLTLSVGIILLVILAVSIGFGIRQRKVNDRKEQYQTLLTEANSEVDQAISLASTNPEESRQLFLSSEQKLDQILELKVKDTEVSELQKKIEDSRAAVLGEYSVNMESFLDLGLLSSGFIGNEISFSGGNVYVLDKSGAKVVSIAIDTKKSEVVSGPDVIENPAGLASYEGNVFVLLPDGIYLVENKKTRVIEKTWGGDALIYAFAGNLYVLDKGGNQIYRYTGQSGNIFGSQQNWLSSSTTANFSDVLEWGMNGAVYVLYPNSKVLKYSLGSPQNFSISGVFPEIGSIDSLCADSDNEYVYLLDRAGSRVVVIDKNGKYKAQYLSDQIGNATKMVVSEAEGKIILLTGNKLYSIEMKNL